MRGGQRYKTWVRKKRNARGDPGGKKKTLFGLLKIIIEKEKNLGKT